MPEESCHRCHHQDSMGEESSRLSTDSSLSSHDPALADYCSLLGVEHSEDERPVSTVSTLSSSSSGEGHSSPFGGPFVPPSRPSPPAGPDIDLELSPPEEPAALLKPESRRPRPELCEEQSNNNNTAAGAAARTPSQISDLPSPVAAEAMAPNPQLTYVDRVVMEIIETERMYVRDLCSIVEDYLAYIIDARDLPIKPEQVCSLFGNIEVIYEFNSELLQSLELCDSDPVAIACCFVDKSEYFNIYTQYCTNYPNSVATLTECMRNKTLAKFFRDRQASLERSLPLGAYLLKPVQRILKYHLLLQEIAKHFDPEEDGYDVVEEAIDTMTGVAWYINDMKRKHEHAVRQQEIQSLLINWKGPDLTTYGELVLEGTFHVQRAKNERTLFLFDKMLLITKKRGEHYVYKTHITCSTLMLIESAKDLLRFSVTHYKHPKQPHTVQAKTVEEKKLWAHHIKRLILENHHAVIPQTAKNAILDMNSPGPAKYRYSPERLKKPMSAYKEDFPAGGRKGRRRSEPMKQTVRTTRGSLKHAESEGTLLGDSSRHLLQPASSVSTLNSTTDEPETEGPALEDRRSEWLQLRTNSLDRLSTPTLQSCRLEMPFEREKEVEVEEEQGGSGEEEEEEEEEVLVKDEQVADFASSVLAAISCWHYRAKALLFTRVPTDVEEASQDNGEETERSQTPSEDQAEASALYEKDPCGDQGTLSSSPSSGGQEESRGRQPPSHPETMSQHGDGEREETNAESSVDSVSPIRNESQLDLTEEDVEDPEVVEDDDEEEEEEEEEEEDEENTSQNEPASLLPTSVLNKASDIAERFISSLSRRGSLVVDDFYSQGCDSESKTGSRRSSLLSLNADMLEKEIITQELSEKCLSEPLTINSIADTDGHPVQIPDQRPPQKQDTLSKKDRMLIHKIKQYYEHAEHQDASFSIRRRESLSYIPAGLVRNLSRQLNCLPDDKSLLPADVQRKASSASSRPASWEVFDLPGVSRKEEKETDINTVNTVRSKDEEVRSSIESKDECFRPSAEMISVWNDMELDVFENAVSKTNQDGHCELASPNQKKLKKSGECTEALLILEDSDNSMAEQEQVPSTLSLDGNYSDSKDHELKMRPNSPHKLQERRRVIHAPLPKIISLRSGSDEDLILQDMEKMKNKVFQLARQYSQRIKNSRPVVRPRARVQDYQFTRKNLPSVIEDKSPEPERGGAHNFILSHASCEPIDLRASSPSSSSSSVGSPRVQSPSRGPALGPQSPVYTESFHWPDVRELRSKYSRHGGQPLPISRSCSVPERMLEAAHGHSQSQSHSQSQRSCSCSTPVYESVVENTTQTKATSSSCCRECQEPAEPAEPKSAAKLCKATSLDHMLGSLHLKQHQNLSEPQRDFYISGEATMPDDNKIIVVERIIPEERCTEGNSLTGEENKEEMDENQLKWDADFDLPAGMGIEMGGITCDSRRLQAWMDSSRTYPVRSHRKSENRRHSLVRNLREKFQNLSSYT
ncbi:pleckstrin homology domain-containing family G member 3 isoform X1 [Astyanax mexicanus]|uniref:pleckstrin homology domain-containing family G member 3 isoform X1 n=1 Tax=Astyanax mexicanus TaxID=7994 RepID=UPI0020CAB0D2|nr:pleckstrin homology domain-containing family G member 3 isoform X1 [Astyanax mexicanus]